MALVELEQDPFDADEFIERLAWKAIGGSKANSDSFDPMVLHQTFDRTIHNLKDMKNTVIQKVNVLEDQCQEEENAHWQKVTQLHKHVQTAFGHFKDLDERINFVATKVVHLGDQLEGVNQPRTRAAEALTLMKYFSEFLDAKKPLSHFFNDPFQVQTAADVIQKLHNIVQELPANDKFGDASARILDKYNEIEKQLIDDFRRAQFDGDIERMKSIASTLSHFKGYSDCINVFIEESQKGSLNKPTLFEDIPVLCETLNVVVKDVFAYSEAVMDKFVVNVYQGKLQKHLDVNLNRSELDKYLQNLYNLYNKTTTLSDNLTKSGIGGGAVAMDKLTKNIFGRYLDKYINDEKMYLKGKCELILNRFYESKNHQKKQIQSGGIYDLRRDIQAAIVTKTNINLGPTVENYGGETFLSQDVVINIMQEFKIAFKRCQSLSSRNELANNAAKIFELIIQYLCIEYIDYAIELGLQAIPLAESKTEPKYYFLNIVNQANSDFHLFEKLYNESISPLLVGTSKNGECLQRKKEVFEAIEKKLDSGLDRVLSSMSGWCKHILSTEQKKSDFKPEAEEGPLMMFSPACGKVVSYLKSWINVINMGLDGKNVDNVLTEFAVRFHRVLFEHLQQFQYNSIGAMMVICDVNEYRKCMKELQIPLVNELFNVLHALCNLLVVVPENLRQVCSGEELVSLEKPILVAFIQLRSDYKTAKLSLYFK